MNAFETIVSDFKLRGTAYFEGRFAGPWGMAFAKSDVANFHLVSSGQCHADFGGEQIMLETGDALLFPHGGAHRLSDGRKQFLPAKELIDQTKRIGDDGVPVFGGAEDVSTQLICGHFEYGASIAHPLWSALPETLILRATESEMTLLAGKLLMREVEDGVASGAIVDRLAELLLIEMVRHYVRTQPDADRFVNAMSDRAISTVLRTVNDRLSESWTNEQLSQVASMSRSAFCERFKDVIGIPPMEYVYEIRLLRGHRALQESDSTLAEIAAEIGYANEFAFSKAFKRRFGQSPGSARRAG